MNFQCDSNLEPLRVLMVNPLSPASNLLAIKMLSGRVFGPLQFIDLILLVYSNEKTQAESFRNELLKCAFSCVGKIIVTSDLPRITDADVFCFMTNFPNPNCLEVEDTLTEAQFDSLYLIIKIANGFGQYVEEPIIHETLDEKNNELVEKKAKKPIIVADGLIPIDIIKTLSKDKIPSDAFFFPTPLTGISLRILGDYLKVKCDAINDVFVWAINDKVFHIEVSNPVVRTEKLQTTHQCGDEVISSDLLNELNMDHTQFSASWLKKEFMEMVAASATKNPYGNIYRASEFAKTLNTIWMSRVDGGCVYANLGVISDGSVETMKGYPYVFPVKLKGDTWTINNRFAEQSHFRQEIRRLNKTIKIQHEKLAPFCKKFLEENVIKQLFIPVEDLESIQDYESSESSL